MGFYDILLAKQLAGSGGGGGGSSDFSIATVTVSSTTVLEGLFLFILTTDMGAPYNMIYPETELSEGEYQVPLYKGGCIFYVTTQGVTVSGNIEAIDDGVYFISGDGTFTIS